MFSQFNIASFFRKKFEKKIKSHEAKKQYLAELEQLMSPVINSLNEAIRSSSISLTGYPVLEIKLDCGGNQLRLSTEPYNKNEPSKTILLYHCNNRFFSVSDKEFDKAQLKYEIKTMTNPEKAAVLISQALLDKYDSIIKPSGYTHFEKIYSENQPKLQSNGFFSFLKLKMS